MRRSIRSSRSAERLLVLLVLLCSAPQARGDAKQARAQFERAETAYKLGRYAEAMQGYEAAYRELPEPAFLFNIAQCHRQQYRLTGRAEHLRRAMALYKSYLRERPDAPNRATVTRLLQQLEQQQQQQQQQKERPPTSSQPASQPGTAPAPATLRLRGARGAQVKLDGVVVGTLPCTVPARPGRRQLEVTLAGHLPWSNGVELSAGKTLAVEVTLQRQDAPRRHAGPGSTPLYKKWWLWTIVGAVAVAGGATGIYFATRSTDSSGMPEIDLR